MHKHKETQGEDHNTEIFIKWMSKNMSSSHFTPKSERLEGKNEEYDAYIYSIYICMFIINKHL